LSRPAIAFLITESWYFLSHRQPLADACQDAGWQTLLITNVAEKDRQRLLKSRVVALDMRRGSLHLLRELATLWRVVVIVRRERPRVLHAVGLKPVLYGSLAARVLGLDMVCALAGLGTLFTSGALWTQLLRRGAVVWLRLLLGGRRSRVIVQNDDDARELITHRVVRASQVVVIRGSGVDLNHFQPMAEPGGPPVFAVVARMLGDKGIRELVSAGRMLRERGIACRIRLVGEPDVHNLSSLTEPDLSAWAREGIVEWVGFQADVRDVWRDAHVCVLPSYREGLPKALLEAAACGRPIITTDVPGCRDVVTDEIEGLLVPARDARALAHAMERLAISPDIRRRMGQAARLRVEADFGLDKIVPQTMALYRDILGQS
jgi:glycosyltransferase involved in cell wall biosynthesis